MYTLSELQIGKDDDQQTSLEELLAFIEGGDGEENEQAVTSKVSKRNKRKQKKVELWYISKFSRTNFLWFHFSH